MTGRLPPRAAIVLTLDVVALLSFAERDVLARVRAAGLGEPPVLLDAFAEMKAISAEARLGRRPVSDPASDPFPILAGGSSAAPSSVHVSTTVAADRLGISTRRVTQLLHSGQLKGRQQGGVNSAWTVAEQSIEDYRTSRGTRTA